MDDKKKSGPETVMRLKYYSLCVCVCMCVCVCNISWLFLTESQLLNTNYVLDIFLRSS